MTQCNAALALALAFAAATPPALVPQMLTGQTTAKASLDKLRRQGQMGS